MVSSDGEWDDHVVACAHATSKVGINLGSNHNGSRGGYFTHGVEVTYASIMANPLLATVFTNTDKELNLWPGSEVGCYLSIIQ